METAAIYIPTDRRQALLRGRPLPDREFGAALFADISGFTPLTETLARTLGPRRGAEELTRQLNRVYDALIDEVDRFGGSVISFSGDAILCWFHEADGQAALRAVTCALAMQTAMRPFAAVSLPNGAAAALAMKATVASGSTRRFVVGDPAIQLIDAVAGATVMRTATAEHLANKGEVLVDEATLRQLGNAFQPLEWRTAPETGERFARLADLPAAVAVAAPDYVNAEPLPDELAWAWLLPAVNERLQAGLGEFLPELRPAVALFLRFEGIDYEGDAEAGVQLDRFTRWVQAIIARYEGSLLALSIGDKGSYLHISFGAPVAHEDDPRRAVSAALELRALPDDLSFLRPLQIGISQGTFRAGAYGGMTRRTYGALGDDVNLAARLMQRAAPGEVLISGPIHRAVSAIFVCETLTPLQVKGKSEPVPVTRVLGRQHGRAAAEQYRTPLVGRAPELRQLLDGLEPILAGRFAGLLAVHGEPGVGKSRLLAEVRGQLEARRPVHWYVWPAEGILKQPLNALQYFLREYFEQTPDLPEDANKARFEGLLEGLLSHLRAQPAPGPELADELDRTRSFLGALAGGLHWPGSLYEQVEPRLRLENTLAASKALILAECLRQPVVVQFEDAQWLDDDSAAFLRLLTRNVRQFPLAVVLTTRYRDDGSRHVLTVDDDVLQAALDLNTLTPAGVQAMAAQTLGGPLRPDLAAFLAERTDGNPFFVEQLAMDLRERGLLTTVSAGADGLAPAFALTSQAQASELPVGINAVLVARLDRLAAQVKAIVQTASVLGQEFEVWVLSQMLRDDKGLVDRVRQAEAESIWSALSETRYLFRHALLRDAAYEMQLQARLRELHALAGAALETVYANDLASYAALLAYHWGRAGDPAREVKYSALAGEQALLISAFRDALRYFERALELVGAGQAAGEITATRLNYGLGEAHAGLGEVKAAVECLQRSLALAQAAGDRKGTADALSLLGGLLFALGEADQAVVQLNQALALAREIDDQTTVGITLSRLGRIARSRGDYRAAAESYELSLAIARVTDNPVRLADVQNSLGVMDLFSKSLPQARQRLQEAQAAFRTIGNRTGVLMTLGNLGMVASELDEFAEARQLYQEALALSNEIGDRRLQAALLDNLGDVSLRLGDDAEAARYFGESLALALDVGAVSAALLALAGIARLRVRAGRHAQAAEMLGLALHHPACDDETRQRGELALAELGTALPAEVLAAAQARGQARSLDEWAAELQAG
ncbi:MAG: tetratricopeptide repeat protein [Anaerolineales bacterium]|nr:tetratricopeptide repeat protein [Anaerolineales bacterium]